MRKRLLVGAIAAVVIGVAVYFLSQPREGTVEWHKRQYLKTLERLSGDTWKDKLQRVYRRVARLQPQYPWEKDTFRSDGRALSWHQTSLIRLGYLQKSRVSLTNAYAKNAAIAGFFGRDAIDAGRRFVEISTEGNQVVHITAPTSDLPAIEAAIRQADVPASK